MAGRIKEYSTLNTYTNVMFMSGFISGFEVV
jgi:hypothetical protein